LFSFKKQSKQNRKPNLSLTLISTFTAEIASNCTQREKITRYRYHNRNKLLLPEVFVQKFFSGTACAFLPPSEWRSCISLNEIYRHRAEYHINYKASTQTGTGIQSPQNIGTGRATVVASFCGKGRYRKFVVGSGNLLAFIII
jgi:hypothetical protein